MPNYFSHLLSGGPVRHKSDPQHINVCKVDIINQDKEVALKQVAAMVQNPAPVLNCPFKAASMIKTKTINAAKAAADVSHTNLILLDHSGTLSSTPSDAFYRMFFVRELRRAQSLQRHFARTL